MSLLTIPPELRLQIYSYLPVLHPPIPHEIRFRTRLTPDVSRACHILRQETLPIYATNTAFNIRLDSSAIAYQPGIRAFLDALGPRNVARISAFTISQHWCMPQPLRWQGHVGFYVRIERRKPRKLTSQTSVNSTSSFRPEWNERFVRPLTEGIWEVTAGTYPVARDIRGMRLESVELLAEVIRHHLHIPTPQAPAQENNEVTLAGLSKADIEFLMKAMDAVASHPIGAYDVDQAESARQRRLDTWCEMEQQLRALNVQNMGNTEGDDGVDVSSSKRFFTPY